MHLRYGLSKFPSAARRWSGRRSLYRSLAAQAEIVGPRGSRLRWHGTGHPFDAHFDIGRVGAQGWRQRRIGNSRLGSEIQDRVELFLHRAPDGLAVIDRDWPIWARTHDRPQAFRVVKRERGGSQRRILDDGHAGIRPLDNVGL